MKMRHPPTRWQDAWRMPRVALYLIGRPGDLVPYLRYGLSSKHTPLDLGKPWWSFGAVKAVGGFVSQKMDVFEFGSGGSTLFLAQRVKTVTCVEDSDEWAVAVETKVRETGMKNVRIMTKHFDFASDTAFCESEYFNALGGQKYDLIVVDGQEWSTKVRPLCFWRAEEFVKPGGAIVVDDSWRYPEIEEKNRAVRFEKHKGVGYCRRGVTSTSVFFY